MVFLLLYLMRYVLNWLITDPINEKVFTSYHNLNRTLCGDP